MDAVSSGTEDEPIEGPYPTGLYRVTLDGKDFKEIFLKQ